MKLFDRNNIAPGDDVAVWVLDTEDKLNDLRNVYTRSELDKLLVLLKGASKRTNRCESRSCSAVMDALCSNSKSKDHRELAIAYKENTLLCGALLNILSMPLEDVPLKLCSNIFVDYMARWRLEMAK